MVDYLCTTLAPLKSRNKNKNKIKLESLNALRSGYLYWMGIIIMKADITTKDGLQVLLNLQNVIFFSQGFLGVAARRAVYLEELPLLLGSSTSHHSTELLVVDPTIL